MRSRVLRAACCVLLVFAACRKAEPPAPSPETLAGDEVDYDRDNLLNLARGASVLSRSGEQTLESSAAHAIDGDATTFWRSPPGGPEQTFVFSLPARSRIDRIGLITPHAGGETPLQVRFDASDDGVAWHTIATLDYKAQRLPRITSVPPFDASYLRVETIGVIGYYASLRSIAAMGRELAPPRQPPAAGCWRINGADARFEQRGTSVVGVIGNDPPMYVIGGTDGRTIRLTWLRGPMWGPALVTLDPQRRALSGVRWHEAARSQNSGDGWFGTPEQCSGAISPQPGTAAGAAAAPPALHLNETAIASAILKRAGVWVAYGDSALDTLAALIQRAPAQRFRVVVRTAALRKEVRAALRARGVDLAHIDIDVVPSNAVLAPQRVIADGVELHAR